MQGSRGKKIAARVAKKTHLQRMNNEAQIDPVIWIQYNAARFSCPSGFSTTLTDGSRKYQR